VLIQSLRLEGTERVLEIGTGLGFQAAILAYLCREVISIEGLPILPSRRAETSTRRGSAMSRSP